MISIIVATAENGVIGKDNQMLWKLSTDFKYFKNLTTGHSVIMGRKTFESIGRPLPNRTNIVISRQQDFVLPEGVLKASSLENAIELAKTHVGSEEIFIIGGGNVYEQALKITDKIYLTEVDANIEGDAFFPTLDMSEWTENSRVSHHKDEKNEYDFDFVVLERN
ncbi:dihydrofolate reductase region [Emticicia oligotrophica DSM 17448]|uniref:Dihydrofolate reductase n=1 Tax=Emticicia oligotrophica (strain DSM 17448 / CIP 109782 / MTCC 6937 / GPTSA100-15) TaxID=929562 RepID=A0ABM5MZG5_EMTOG|nr:dihydrofolate reductase [Emticicia oligotrophica]AFK02580.1 dihydrofolate reductase region [Emticicia oligotrophica DSM 17448]